MNEFSTRKRIRLQGYDYSQNNYYFITICTYEKSQIFGIEDHLTDFGKIAENCLRKIQDVFSGVRVDKYVVMPNHIHAIVVFERNTAARMYACPTLGTVIGNYKAAVSRDIHLIDPKRTVWQKRYYDHIIRDQKDYKKIWTYIDENPVKWESDEYY